MASQTTLICEVWPIWVRVHHGLNSFAAMQLHTVLIFLQADQIDSNLHYEIFPAEYRKHWFVFLACFECGDDGTGRVFLVFFLQCQNWSLRAIPLSIPH